MGGPAAHLAQGHQSAKTLFIAPYVPGPDLTDWVPLQRFAQTRRRGPGSAFAGRQGPAATKTKEEALGCVDSAGRGTRTKAVLVGPAFTVL